MQIWLAVRACRVGHTLFGYCTQEGVPTAQAKPLFPLRALRPSHRPGQDAPSCVQESPRHLAGEQRGSWERVDEQMVSKAHPWHSSARRQGGQPLDLPHLLPSRHKQGRAVLSLCWRPGFPVLPCLGTGLGLGSESGVYFWLSGGNLLSFLLRGSSPGNEKGLAEARKSQGVWASSHLDQRGWKLLSTRLAVFPLYGFVAGEGKSASRAVNNNRKSTWKWWLEQIKQALHGTAWKQLHLLPCPSENVTQGGNGAEKWPICRVLFLSSFHFHKMKHV